MSKIYVMVYELLSCYVHFFFVNRNRKLHLWLNFFCASISAVMFLLLWQIKKVKFTIEFMLNNRIVYKYFQNIFY